MVFTINLYSDNHGQIYRDSPLHSMLLGGNEVKIVCAGLKVVQFRPNIDLELGGEGGGSWEAPKFENMYWTGTKASVPKEFVRDCRSARND